MSRSSTARLKAASALLEEHLPERPYARFTGLGHNGPLMFTQIWACFEGVQECSTAGWRTMIPISLEKVCGCPSTSAEFVIEKLDEAARRDGVFFWEI